MNMLKSFLILTLIYFSIYSFCSAENCLKADSSRSSASEGRAVISINDYSVGIEEFSDRLNFSPSLRQFSGEMNRKQDIAASIIAGKILADQAVKKNYDTVQSVKATIAQYENEAVYEYWMQKEISEKVHIKDSDLQKAYPRFAEQRIVDYLVFKDQNSAKKASDEIDKGRELNSFKTKDGKSLVQTKEIEFGESLQKVEDLIYSLKAGQTTPVVPIAGSYYIFELKKAIPHPKYSTQSFDYWKPAIEKRLKARGTTSEFEKVMPALMKDRKFTVNKKVYEYTLSALSDKLQFDPEKAKLPEALNQELADIPGSLESNLSEPFMKFEDGTVWTVGDIWQKLRFGPYLLNYKSKDDFRKDFSYLLRTVVILETVMNDGYKKGYENTAYVKDQTSMWKNDLLSKLFMFELGKNISISEEELKTYYSDNPSRFKAPDMCRIKEILVDDEKLAENLVNRINSGEDMTKLTRQYSTGNLTSKEAEQGIFVARNTMGKIGDIAFSLQPGQIYGPVKLENNKYSVIKLIEFVNDKVKPFNEVHDDIRAQILKNKLHTQLQKILSESIDKYNISINKNNFEKVQMIEGSMLVRKSHFPNRNAVPLPIDISHEEEWFQDLWNRQ